MDRYFIVYLMGMYLLQGLFCDDQDEKMVLWGKLEERFQHSPGEAE
jgi:hypothetical protein